MSENQFGNPGNGHQGDMPYCWMGKMIITIIIHFYDINHYNQNNVTLLKCAALLLYKTEDTFSKKKAHSIKRWENTDKLIRNTTQRSHYNAFTWALSHLKSPVTRFLFQQLIRANNERFKAPQYWPKGSVTRNAFIWHEIIIYCWHRYTTKSYVTL